MRSAGADDAELFAGGLVERALDLAEQTSAKPRMALSGVRSSWLSAARKAERSPVERRGEGEILVVRAFGGREPSTSRVERRREHAHLIEARTGIGGAGGIGIGFGHRRDAVADVGDIVAHVFGEHVPTMPAAPTSSTVRIATALTNPRASVGVSGAGTMAKHRELLERGPSGCDGEPGAPEKGCSIVAAAREQAAHELVRGGGPSEASSTTSPYG